MPVRPQWTGDSLLSTNDLALYLSCSVRTLVRWRSQGKGPPPIAVNGVENRHPTYAYRFRDVLAWLDRQPRGPQPLRYERSRG